MAARVSPVTPVTIRAGGILTIDSGHALGWAYAYPSDPPLYGHVNLPRPNAKGFASFRRWLATAISEYSPQIIVYEEPILNHFGPNKTSLQTAQWLIGLYAHTVELALWYGVRCEPANASKIKKFLTNDGRSKKPAMIAAIEDCGWHPQTSDEADALAILLWAEVKYAPHTQRDIGALGPLFAR